MDDIDDIKDPLEEMTREELQKELEFRRAIRDGFDGSNGKTHRELQASVDAVRRQIKMLENPTFKKENEY
ncbi:hypothetical protein J7J83_01665 [bacterium]|nr:hypothetical protein [bacterium]